MCQIVDRLYLSNFNDIKRVPDDWYVVNCTKDFPMLRKGMRVAVDDDGNEIDVMYQALPAAVAYIHERVTSGDNVVVHCLAGQQRSPTVVCAYLMAYHKVSMQDAISHIRHKKPDAFLWDVNFRIALEQYAQRLDQLDSNESHSEIFESIYQQNIWGDGGGDGSGEGSDPQFAQGLIHSLKRLIDFYGIKTILDAPCGSALWVPGLLRLCDSDFKYHGVDVSPTAVDRARKNLGAASAANATVSTHDLTVAPVPGEYDMVLCRDALQHMSYADITAVIGNLQRTNAKWFVIGGYINGHNENIATGKNNFLINLMDAPFNMKPDFIVAELHPMRYYHKHLYIYSRESFTNHVLVEK